VRSAGTFVRLAYSAIRVRQFEQDVGVARLV
jgi:hypothetical protein